MGLPIGAMVTGYGGIGSESIATLLKDFHGRLDGTAVHPWTLDRSSYTIKEVAVSLREFLFSEKVATSDGDIWMKLRSCGYSAGRPLPEFGRYLCAEGRARHRCLFNLRLATV